MTTTIDITYLSRNRDNITTIIDIANETVLNSEIDVRYADDINRLIITTSDNTFRIERFLKELVKLNLKSLFVSKRVE